ncbi:MAG: HPr family phosphocarrier protein [Lachnospiraceae bacterium]|jgi:catabolite repression HPr-like protein|nr:HPr family phosphocarrier protein [Lachnospiraceae bacterium]MCR4801755.1 HPr family phosphocarrier protein [Lachnospiraceae bacterium]
MVTKTMVVANGLEGRTVASLVQIASRYKSSVYIEVENKKVNAKSIMGMMSLGIAKGEKINVVATGEDEQEALENVETFVTGKYS